MSEAEVWLGLSDVPSVADERWHLSQNGSEPPTYIPFAGLSHAEVLELEFPEERMLIKDLVPIGAVGTIAGVPETYKSWQAQTIAVAVASGQGGIFGRDVVHSGPVGYFWQDDSTREEAERIKLFERVHGTGPELNVRWFLNEGLTLPADMSKLKLTIEQYGFCLVVLDSFYNVLLGTKLKEDEAEQVVAALKSEIADATNCTVLIVDHMPWATEVNRGRLRSYGGVFKGAATRFGIYIDAVGNKLWVEARGNNITGFKKTIAEWDSEALELRLVDMKDELDDTHYENLLIEYLTENPDSPTADLAGKEKKIKGTNTRLVAAKKALLDAKRVVRRRERTNEGRYLWNVNVHAENSSSFDLSNYTEPNEQFGGSTSSLLRSEVASELIDPSTETPVDEDCPF